MMNYSDITKLMEIQYLKGRLDELYKGYVPNHTSTDNRIVDSRISKYENKLKSLDEIAFYLYQVEKENVRFSKHKSKSEMKSLLQEILVNLPNSVDEELESKIQRQINKL